MSSTKINSIEPISLSRRHGLLAMFSIALGLFAFSPLQRLAALSLDTSNSHLSYIPLIPFISAFLIFSSRETIFSELRSSTFSGAATLFLGGLLYYAGLRLALNPDERGWSLALLTAGVIAFWLGGFLLAYGSTAFKAALFPLLFLSLAIPMPDRVLNSVVVFLQKGSAEVVAILFALTQTPVFREGTVFVLPGVAIEVAEACSGIRSTLGIVIITILASHLLLRSNWKRAALVIAVIPISLLKNAVRIVTLTLLAVHFDMGFLTGSLHNGGGFLFMGFGLALMYPVLAILSRTEKNQSNSGVRS
jgi:exosortase